MAFFVCFCLQEHTNVNACSSVQIDESLQYQRTDRAAAYRRKMKANAMLIMYSKLAQLSREMPGVMVNVALADLAEWHKELLADAKKELEEKITEQKAETHVSPKRAAEIFDVDPSTLHRWKQKGYLVPVEVGGKRRYKMSDINRILQGGHK